MKKYEKLVEGLQEISISMLKGKKWSDLSEEVRDKLLSASSVWEDVVGECIVDFECGVSVAGINVVNEEEAYIDIPDNAILYDPREGVIGREVVLWAIEC